MSSTGTNNTSLINTVDDSKTIPTLSSSTSEADFPVNKWGYKVGTDTSSNYLPYTSGVTIGSNSGRVNSDTTTLNIASKVDYLTTPGDYKQTFTFTALPHVTQYYMQDLDDATLANQVCVKDAPSIVIDNRDEQAYMIQRLDDGKCWMLDNLNLDLTNKTIVDNLTTVNTHADAASLKSLKEGNRTNCGEEDCSRYATSGLTLSSYWTDGKNSIPLVQKTGTCSTTSNYPCTYNGSYTSNAVMSTLTPSQSTFGLGSGKIGVYYNYCAASAGNYCYNADGASADLNIDYDICPANWKLPSGGADASSDFNTLCKIINNGTSCGEGVAMNGNNSGSFQYKLSTPLSGWGGSNYMGYRQGDYGRFWSSNRSVNDNTKAFVIRTFSDAVLPHETDYRTNGNSVRCLLQE